MKRLKDNIKTDTMFNELLIRRGEKMGVKDISKEEIESNLKIAKKRIILLYTIPLVLIVIVALAYLITQINWLLIPFAVLMLITLFGWDSGDRTCPNCKKWNAVSWGDSKSETKVKKVKKKDMLGREKVIEKKQIKRRFEGKCNNCGYEFEKERLGLL